MKVLYLDFDGVLHPEQVFFHPQKGIYLKAEDHTQFEWTPQLVQILNMHPDVQIVLSTSWVRQLGKDGAIAWLPPALQTRVVGTTADDLPDSWSLPHRGQIVRAAERLGLEWWIAIDDDDYQWPQEYRDRLVKTNGGSGLSDPTVRQTLRHMLARFEP